MNKRKVPLSVADKSALRVSAVALILALVLLFLAGCSTRGYVAIGAGGNSGNWDNCGNTGHYGGLGVRGPVTENLEWEAGYDHYSQWNCGRPHNSKSESFLNHWGAKVRYFVW